MRVEAEGGGAGSAQTFSAYGHHYALVVVEGLPAGRRATRTRCWLDERRGLAGSRTRRTRRPVIRTRPADDGDQPVSLIFGSCREATPHATGRRCRRTRWTPTPAG